MRIETARRENTHTLTSIAGASGSGKTYSSILYARGLVGKDGRIGLIDTENKRSRYYSDIGGGFEVMDLRPPFSPGRYIEAIDAFESAGFKCVVIDSMSHEWDGSGGVCEMADEIELATKKPGLHCWRKPKLEHKRLMNRLLQARMHLVFSCRAKEVHRQTKQNGRTVIVNEGWVAIAERNFVYEMTVSMMLDPHSHQPVLTKCPEHLLSAFPKNRLIGIESGAAVREWAEEGEAVDEDAEMTLTLARSCAGLGLEKFKAWFDEQSKAKQAVIRTIERELTSIINAADKGQEMVQEQMSMDDEPSVQLNDDRVQPPNGSGPVQQSIFGDEARADG